jgi:hypothetical protein
MGRQISGDLNQILKQVPNQAIVTAKWLSEQGISRQLLLKYKNSQWLKMLANGAYVKLNDKFTIDSGIYAMQSQLGLSIHIGGRSALARQGTSHFVRVNETIHLYGKTGETLPKWFKDVFDGQYQYFTTQFLPDNVGLVENNNGNFSTQISSKERAILEMLYFAPEKTSHKEAYQLMEMLLTLRPALLQKLLEECSSVKVKRLFLYIAEKVGYPAFKKLDLSKIDLGKGKRVIIKGGKLYKKYNIVIDSIEDI